MATPKEVAKAKKENIKVKRYTPPASPTRALHRRPAAQRPNKALGKVGTDERKRKVFQGGLRIYTTLQRPKQAMAANAVQGQMDQFGGDPAGALASVEPSTGRIVALYGGRSFKKSQVDLATAQAAPASSRGRRSRCSSSWPPWRRASPRAVLPGPAQITIPNRRYTGYNQPWTPATPATPAPGPTTCTGPWPTR